MKNPKIVGSNEAKSYRRNGLVAIDCHMHSSASYDNPQVEETSPFAIVRRQSEMGLVKLLTDHDTLGGVDELNERGIMDVIRGVEIKILPKKGIHLDLGEGAHTLHFNLFNIDAEQYSTIRNIIATGDLDCLVDYFASEEIAWQYNHPAWSEPGETFNQKQMVSVARDYAPVIELNACRPKYANDVAIFLARQFNKGISGGSDGHTGVSSVGRSYAIARGSEFKEAWQNIVDGNSTIVKHDATPESIIQDATRMINYLFEDKRLTSKNKEDFYDFRRNFRKEVGLNLPIVPRFLWKNALLLYSAILGKYTARKIYIDPVNSDSKKILANLQGLCFAQDKN